MKNSFVICSMTLVLTILFFSGCFDGDKSNDNNVVNNFVGTWYGWVLNDANRQIWTFYQNGSVKIDDYLDIQWGTYSIDSNELEIKKLLSGFPGEYSTMWYTFSFIDDKHFNFKMFSDEIDGDFYKDSILLDEDSSKLIGKWSNNTEHWKNNGETWDYIWNCTFFTNGSVLVENNWYYSDSDEIKWLRNWYYFYIDEEGYLWRGGFGSPFSFTNNDKVLNWDLGYTKIE
jgi:hypothetical protein